MEQYLKILKEDLFLKTLKEENLGTSFILTGGAVVDILSGITPKDYDFMWNPNIHNNIKKNPKFILKYTSSTAVTYEYLGKIVQLLYKDPLDFPYTIEQSKYDIQTQSLTYFDSESFEQKLLIPNKEVYKSRTIAKHVVRRLLHWQEKGFNIHNITFNSVLKTAFKKCKGYTDSDFEDEES